MEAAAHCTPGALRVLQVEDDPDDAMLAQRALRGRDFAIQRSTTLAEAREALQAGAFDCVLLDLNLPDAWGMDSIAGVAGLGVPIVALTGLDESVGVEALRAGATDFLAKDHLRPRDLVRVVRHAVERQRLDDVRRRLAEAERDAAVGRLAAGLAHEVNNPAAFMIANLDIFKEYVAGMSRFVEGARALAERAGPEHLAAFEALEAEYQVAAGLEDTRQVIDEHGQGVRRITALVRTLGTFGGNGGGGTAPVDLAEVLRDAAAMAMVEIKGRAVLEEAIEPLPPVHGDRTALARTFLDLLLNAAEAMPDDDPEHTIRLAAHRQDDRVRVTVQDNGRGIPAADLRRVFHPFFTTKVGVRAAGLGLTHAAEIARRHGGHIDVESELGVGSSFTVDLPVARGQAGGRVLLFEPDLEWLRTWGRGLQDAHDVALAADLDEALALLEGPHPFDVVVCRGPGGAGASLRDALRWHRPDLLERVLVCLDDEAPFDADLGGAAVPDPVTIEGLRLAIAGRLGDAARRT
jgi:two-component system NtrC family sensor kinase